VEVALRYDNEEGATTSLVAEERAVTELERAVTERKCCLDAVCCFSESVDALS
jgi:hypothetical protein